MSSQEPNVYGFFRSKVSVGRSRGNWIIRIGATQVVLTEDDLRDVMALIAKARE